ncbi:PQQ-dependent sugar dehydrogenase [bacterium]|nr:PQQ-dependent sugar dehydrogenase [bacterium]
MIKLIKKYFTHLLIVFLTILLVTGYFVNRENSFSKKNEIANFAKQLNIRNEQIVKIQKNLFKDGKNINDFINEKQITFNKIFENKKLDEVIGNHFSKDYKSNKNLNQYLVSKYKTNDMLFTGNIGATATGYVDFFNKDQNLLMTTYDGVFGYSDIKNIENFKKIKSNLRDFINYDEFHFHLQYGIKDIFVNKDIVYISYIDEESEDCFDLKIISANININFLNFENFFKTSDCVKVNNGHGFWPHQGAGGRIFLVDENHILFTTGDFRNRPLAQDLKSDFGKIIKINLKSKKSKIVSIGHRNPQGLFYSKKFDFILSTEHGPKGGDEINLNHKPFNQIKNFGWPIASYGDHYHKNYSERILREAPLNKNHKKYGFIEPIKYFNPSIGISEVKSISKNDNIFIIGAMGNEIKDMDLGLHLIELDVNYKKIINHVYLPINERIRDIIVSKKKDIVILFLETTSSLLIFKKIK